MADVRGAAGVPLAAAFNGAVTPTPSTPIYVDTNNADLYVLLGSTVTRVLNASTSTALTATGTNQATALPLPSVTNAFSTVASGTGATLVVGPQQTVYNGGVNTLRVYPPTGAKINGLATNAPGFLVPGATCTFSYVSSTLWIANLSA